MYTLNLTAEDVCTIDYVAGHYCWASVLRDLSIGENHLSEFEAWRIKEAFDDDAIGGHQMFPMLDPDSKLASKLIRFWNEIV